MKLTDYEKALITAYLQFSLDPELIAIGPITRTAARDFMREYLIRLSQ